MTTDDRREAYPLLGTVQNSVGYGFVGNETVTAIAHRLKLRTVAVPTAWASARGGMDGRATIATNVDEFQRALEFTVLRDPAVLIIGFLPRPEMVDAVAKVLVHYHGLVVLDPVLGSYEKGLYVSIETARRIREELVPRAQVVTPNRFEAEVLLDLTRDRGANERTFLDGFSHLGPTTVVITSWVRDMEKRQMQSIFSNGYVYQRITGPLHTTFPGYGAGDTFTGALAGLLTCGASPWSATVLASALTSLAVERTSGYGGATVDPIAALDLFKPLPNIEDDKARRYAERFGVVSAAIPASDGQEARLKFAPPVNQTVY